MAENECQVQKNCYWFLKSYINSSNKSLIGFYWFEEIIKKPNDFQTNPFNNDLHLLNSCIDI